jgi:hypothetical protein
MLNSNRKHSWIGLGLADMTQAQAEEWATAEGRSMGTPLAMYLRVVVCVSCDQVFGPASEECPGIPVTEPWEQPERDGDPRTPHHWSTLATVTMTEEEAENWALGEGFGLSSSPCSVALVCALCGQTYDEADEDCREKVLVNVSPGEASE